MAIRTEKPFRIVGAPNNAPPTPITPQGIPALSQLQGTAQMVGPFTPMPPLQTPALPFRNLK